MTSYTDYHKEYYEKNKDLINEKKRANYKKNPEKYKVYHKKYYENNKEKIREQKKQYYLKKKALINEN